MKIKYLVAALLAGFVAVPAIAAQHPDKNEPVKISVNTSEVGYEIEPELFGVCPMFWSESDSVMADGVIEKRLAEMKCRFLRFPGGTDSDNFDWRTNTLVNNKRWPYLEGQDKMSTDEFIALCRRLKAEPIICVNTEIAFFQNDQAAIDLAAGWVRYCNIEKKYNVKYWEIGNEPYYHARFNPTEYAELLVKMSTAMKAVDPDIKIAAVGECSPDYTGVKEEIHPDSLAHAQELEYIFDSGKFEYLTPFYALRTQKSSLKWWDEVVRIAADHFDVASIHWYYSPSHLNFITSTLHRLDRIINPENADHHVELIMTEWSLHESNEIYGLRRALTVGEAIGRMSDGLVKKTNYWPLRCEGTHDKKGLIDMTAEKKPHANFHVMKLLANHIGTERVASAADSDRLYQFASRSGKTTYVYLINHSDEDVLAEVTIEGKRKMKVESFGLTALTGQPESDEVIEIHEKSKAGEHLIVNVPACSIIVYEIR